MIPNLEDTGAGYRLEGTSLGHSLMGSFNRFRAHLAGIHIDITRYYENEGNNWEAARALMKCFSFSPRPNYPLTLPDLISPKEAFSLGTDQDDKQAYLKGASKMQ